nr:putative phage tail protein [uncultured Anaerostipes sp.]
MDSLKNAEETITHLPDFLREYREMKVLCKQYDRWIDRIWGLVDELYCNQFIPTATETGISRYEKIFGITKKDTDTLEERRFNLMLAVTQQLPYTYANLILKLNTLLGSKGYSIDLINEEYRIEIRVALNVKDREESVLKLLRRELPANMIIDVDLDYNDHKALERFTYDQLAEWNYDHLRNEVLV